MEHLAILMTVYNRKDSTLQCLQNLSKQIAVPNIHFDIYLTDDGCTDGTAEAVRASFPDVNIIAGDGNLFWNRGMWTAWDAASKAKDYDYYLWLNDDTYIYESAIKDIVILSQKLEDNSIIVGACQSLDHKYMTYGGRVNKQLVVPNGIPQEVSTANGNILLVPQSVFRVLGNLDYHLHHGGGDFDYSWRAGRAGIKCIQTPKYVGECDKHEKHTVWCNPEVPLLKRLKSLYKPYGMPPTILFYQERKMFGLPTACFHFLTVHLRCLCPWIWTIKGDDKYLKK